VDNDFRRLLNGRLLDMTPADVRDLTIRQPADLCLLWTGLLHDHPFRDRALWVTFLHDDGQVAPLLVPIEDLPRTPEPRMADGLRDILGQLVGRDGIGSAALLLSRPGVETLTREDRAWGQLLRAVSPRWPIALATPGRVQLLEAEAETT
jgi:hypothetical protein